MLAAVLGLTAQHASALCTLNVQGVIFGSYDVFSNTNLESTGNIGVTCAPSSAYSITLNTGAGSYASRIMASGANQLSYNLYTDATYTSVWGDGTAGSGVVNGSGLSANHTVYGRIPARQNVPVGNYADTITVTITF